MKSSVLLLLSIFLFLVLFFKWFTKKKKKSLTPEPVGDDFNNENEEDTDYTPQMDTNYEDIDTQKNDSLVAEIHKYDPSVKFKISSLLQNEKEQLVDDTDEKNYVLDDIVALGDFDPTLELSRYKTPPIELLADHKSENYEENSKIVSMRSIIASRRFQEANMKLPIALGKTITDEPFIFDITRMPNLLIAGTTGQGKTVALNVIITSILYKKHPSQVKFILCNIKSLEFFTYEKIEQHFLSKLADANDAIIADTQKLINTLNSLCIEMDSRYSLLKEANVRNIKEYNTKFIARKLNPILGHRYIPYIVVVIDEFSNFGKNIDKEMEMIIVRLAQKASNVGIHMIIATQYLNEKIITNAIKTNFPARIAFRVSSLAESRLILDTSGANKLYGHGKLLFSSGGAPINVKCAFLDMPEVDEITHFISNQQGFPTAMFLPDSITDETNSKDVDLSKKDELFDDSARLLVIHQQGSTSLIQRKFSIGFARAGRIMDQLGAAGIIGPHEDGKARQVLFVDLDSLEKYMKKL